MGKLSFDETMTRFDLIVLDMNDVDKKNNIMFRRLCREIFQKSYSQLELKNNLNAAVNITAAGIISAIKMARGQNKKGLFIKSFRKLNSQTRPVTYSDLNKVNRFLDKSEFALVLKLLKIQYKYGFNEVISFVIS